MKNSKRELILSALLTNSTVKEAAATCGVPETTVYNWLRKDDFAEEYKQRKRQSVEEAGAYLQSKLNTAIKIIDELMNDTDVPPQIRLNAAKTIIDTAYKVIAQAELTERIEALELAAGDNGQ